MTRPPLGLGGLRRLTALTRLCLEGPGLLPQDALVALTNLETLEFYGSSINTVYANDIRLLASMPALRDVYLSEKSCRNVHPNMWMHLTRTGKHCVVTD